MAKAEGITVVREVVVQYRGPRFRQREAISDPPGAAAFVRRLLPDNSREHFVTLYLDGSNTIIGYSMLTGIANACPVHAREVFQPAVLLGATAVLVAHNHPSGKCEPSAEDHKVTEGLQSAGAILGIKLLDHLVLGDVGSVHSYREQGRL